VVPVTDLGASIGQHCGKNGGVNSMKINKEPSAVVARDRRTHAMQKCESISRQAGMTAIGVLILVLFVGLFAFAGIRLTPVYLNYM
jgi:hypothetical protein